MIYLASYNPEWPHLYEVEKQKLMQILKPYATTFEHIGSTSIPGIKSKPVIDILIGVNNLKEISAVEINKLAELGYQYMPAFEKEFPHRKFFQKNDKEGNRTHQIHMVNFPSCWWQRHLLFRDYLRKIPNKAKAYEALKIELAPQFTDTTLYAKAKSDFCLDIYKLAYFDFEINKPLANTKHLLGYLPQSICFDIYQEMFQDPKFIQCFGLKLSDEEIKNILARDTNNWDQYRVGPLVWFDKKTHEFVGEGGLNHKTVDGKEEVELTYSLREKFWGKGLAVEIGKYAIDFAFKTLKLNNIVCFTLTTNQQSQRVMQKLGFKYEKDFTYYNLPHQLYRLKNPSLKDS